jgi:hypothetical protein
MLFQDDVFPKQINWAACPIYHKLKNTVNASNFGANYFLGGRLVGVGHPRRWWCRSGKEMNLNLFVFSFSKIFCFSNWDGRCEPVHINKLALTNEPCLAVHFQLTVISFQKKIKILCSIFFPKIKSGTIRII